MALINLFLFHPLLNKIEALQIKDQNGVHSPGNITQIWYEPENEQTNIFIKIKQENLSEADPDDLTIETNEYEKILDNAELTLFDVKNNAEIIKIPLKRRPDLYFEGSEVLQTKNQLTRINSEKIDELLFKICFKVNKKISVEYSLLKTKDEGGFEGGFEEGNKVFIYNEEGIAPVIKVTEEEEEKEEKEKEVAEVIPDSEEVGEFVPVKFWTTQAGVGFLVISVVTVLFFVVPSFWRFYKILVNK